MAPGILIRDLTTLAELREAMALEQEIWGSGDPADNVGFPIFVVTVKRGGILLGAWDGGRLAGFVYSLAGLKDGRPIQWSHMLGVRAPYRHAGIGRELKWAQRERAMGMGIDLMEWTFDPLQAVNARLNFERLGVVVEEYHEDVYGDSTSPLHLGNPTDRFIAQWWMRSPRVARRAPAVRSPAARSPEALASGSPEAMERPLVLASVRSGGWAEPARIRLGLAERELAASIPGAFTEMLAQEPGLAQAWRLATREVFTHYLGRGFRAVDFVFDRASGGGAYVLSNTRPPDLDR